MEKVITKLYNINERSELKPKYIMKNLKNLIMCMKNYPSKDVLVHIYSEILKYATNGRGCVYVFIQTALMLVWILVREVSLAIGIILLLPRKE